MKKEKNRNVYCVKIKKNNKVILDLKISRRKLKNWKSWLLQIVPFIIPVLFKIVAYLIKLNIN